MNEFYEENGYLLVRGVFDAGEVEEMRDAIARILESVEGTAADRNHRWSGVDETLQLKGFHDLQYHDAVFTRMVAHPGLVAVLTDLIGPNVQLHHRRCS
jgi:phytanoyl-CoA hydroxylase